VDFVTVTGFRGFREFRFLGRPHRPHRRQKQVLGIGKMCLVRCMLLISIKRKGTGYGFHVFLTCILLLLLLIQCKISLYLGPVRCFVTPVLP